MSRVCPKCHMESPVDADFCPACGAPMNEHVLDGQEKAAQRALENPTMKWHKFLIYFSLPASIVMAIYGLVTSWQTASSFDASLYRAEYVNLIRFSTRLDVAMELITLLLVAAAEWQLVHMNWRGVKLLLAVYAVETVYTAVLLYMLIQVHADLLEPAVSLVGSAVMIVLTRIYYNKRKKLFTL